MNFIKTGVCLLLVSLVFLDDAQANNCNKGYLDVISSNYARNCQEDKVFTSSEAICSRYLDNLKKCLIKKIDNAYFFNIFYNSGDSKPNSNVMNDLFKSAFEEIVKSISTSSEKVRVTIVGHSDPLRTKSDSNFDINSICTKATIDNNSNACLSLSRAYYLYSSFQKYLSQVPSHIKNLALIEPPCYSIDFFIRNINEALKGKVWSEFKIEKTIQTLLNRYDINPEFFMLEKDSSSWDEIPKLGDLIAFRERNEKTSVLQERIDEYKLDLRVFRTVVLVVWTGKKAANNDLFREKKRGLYCLPNADFQ